MGFFTSPVVGPTSITGLTSPTYTLADDTAPDSNGKQSAVTTLGGTQTGVIANSVAAPFTITVWRPKSLKVLGPLNAATGAPSGVGARNNYVVNTRKGVLPLAAQPYQLAGAKSEFTIPAGSDLADAPNLKAMIALHSGALFGDANKIATLVTTGVLA